MKEYIVKILNENINIKQVIGAVLVLLGLAIHLIPFVPGSWLIIMGLELLGLRLLLQNKIIKWFKRK